MEWEYGEQLNGRLHGGLTILWEKAFGHLLLSRMLFLVIIIVLDSFLVGSQHCQLPARGHHDLQRPL